MTQGRFVSFVLYDDEDPKALSEEEFRGLKARNDPQVDNSNWEEWVWQHADSKEQAIEQHWAKMDAWHANPDLGTY